MAGNDTARAKANWILIGSSTLYGLYMLLYGRGAEQGPYKELNCWRLILVNYRSCFTNLANGTHIIALSTYHDTYQRLSFHEFWWTHFP